MEEGFFDPCNRPVQVEIRSGFRIEIGRTSAWDPILVDHVERHFGVAREHIDTFFQLPATIRSDTGVTFDVTISWTCSCVTFRKFV